MRCMRRWFRLRVRASRLATYSSFVAETLGGGLTAAAAVLSALAFLFVLFLAPVGAPSSGLFAVLFFTNVGYSAIALSGASAMASDLRGSAQVFLSQPLSRTIYALAWLVALLASMIAVFSALLLSLAVIDPGLLGTLSLSIALAWLLDSALLSLLLLAAALLLRRTSVLVITWAAVEFGVSLLFFSEQLAQAVVVLRPLYGVLLRGGAVDTPALAGSALLAAALLALLYWLARARLEV